MKFLSPLVTALLCGMVTGLPAAEKPNVIVIFTDDHGYSDLSCQGVYDDVKTPHIDALAEGGVRMTDGYATAPQCVPSRGGLMSGQYQNRFGLESNPEFRDAAVMKRFADLQTVAERLQSVGYATGMAGKWHLGEGKEIGSHGFDKFFHKNSNRPGTWNMNFDGKDLEISSQQGDGYHLDLVADFACSFIKRYKDQPFYFYLPFRAPHVPLDAPRKYLDRFPGEMPERRRQALAMLSAVDDGVGRIMNTLREHELEENTLLFLIGDNGAPLKIHKLDAPGGGPGWDGSLNDPMNGEKGMLTEGGIRTPVRRLLEGHHPRWPGLPSPLSSRWTAPRPRLRSRAFPKTGPSMAPTLSPISPVKSLELLTRRSTGAGSARPPSAKTSGNTCAARIANTCFT